QPRLPVESGARRRAPGRAHGAARPGRRRNSRRNSQRATAQRGGLHGGAEPRSDPVSARRQADVRGAPVPRAGRPAPARTRVAAPGRRLGTNFRPVPGYNGPFTSALGPRRRPPLRDPMRKRPEAAGLYDPNFEHDNCGIGAVADLTGDKKHETVTRALNVLDRLEHRGASGSEIDTGDGAGLLCQVPDEFFRAAVDFELPQAGEYAVGVVFLPRDDDARRQELEALIERTIAAEGQTLLGWRDAPVD